MNESHDGEDEEMEGIGAGIGVFNIVESSRRDGSGSFREGVFTGVFGFINKSGTLILENEGSIGAGTGESIGSFEEGSGTVTGSDDARGGFGNKGDLLSNEGGLLEMCSLLA